MSSSAGVLFTNKRLVLAGFQPRKGKIDGIGGKAEGQELPHQTAARELLEELLDILLAPPELLRWISDFLFTKSILQSKGYVQYVCSFEDLEEILRQTNSFFQNTPTTLQNLLLHRLPATKNAEITHLCLLPVVPDMHIAGHFMRDISQVLTT